MKTKSMTNDLPKSNHVKGVTLIEMTVVILVILLLVGLSIFSIDAYKRWQIGSEASQRLRQVQTAQKTFLADNPTLDITALTEQNVIDYLSDGAAVLPDLSSSALDGEALTYNISTIPPVLMNGGVVYDPSGSSTDGLWDVGN